MKVRVKLFGMLGEQFPGYDHANGIEVEILDGARVRDLLANLEISESQAGIVFVNARIRKPDDKLEDGALVSVLQPVFGG